jgi:GT2 family glycosyltransferase
MLNILTLTWNAIDKLTKLKDSLLPALSEINYCWIIKDNNSNDNTADIASTWDNVKVIRSPNNSQNFSEGCNICFQEAAPNDNDLVMLLNNDVIFNDTQSIRNMINLFNSDKDIGVVGARLLYTGTNQLQHAGVVINNYGHPLHFRSKQPSDVNAEKNRLFQAVTGAALITKAEYYKNVCSTNKNGIKGLDQRFIWAFDDIDLCLSIKNNMDKKIVYCGKTNISHEESATLKKTPANKLFLTHNLNYLRDKWFARCEDDYNKYKNDPKYNLYK